jgi:hypothetical protein
MTAAKLDKQQVRPAQMIESDNIGVSHGLVHPVQ